jgi:hypothetical protein
MGVASARKAVETAPQAPFYRRGISILDFSRGKSQKTYTNTLEDLDNGLNLGVIKSIGRGIGMNTEVKS